jgi:aspartate/methionine/tyrosine aminotransferase
MRECRAQGKSLVPLMRSEPDFPTPRHIVEACGRALRSGRTSYPGNRGEKSFREAVAQKLKRDNNLRFDPVTEVPTSTGCTFGTYAALAAPTYSRTGWKVGYCAGPAPLIQAMFMVLAQSSRGPATFVQDAAEALRGSQECAAQMRQEYSRRRELVETRLADNAGLDALPPEGGFCTLVDVRKAGIASNEIRQRLTHEHGFVVVQGAAYGPGGEGTLRVSFASGGDTPALGLDRLSRGLAPIMESKH